MTSWGNNAFGRKFDARKKRTARASRYRLCFVASSNGRMGLGVFLPVKVYHCSISFAICDHLRKLEHADFGLEKKTAHSDQTRKPF
jgi:hypothetical protein